MHTVSLTLPFVAAFSDYHEIAEHAKVLSRQTGTRIRSAELDTDVVHGRRADSFYLGVFYIGRKPSAERIVDAIALSRLEVTCPLGYYPHTITY